VSYTTIYAAPLAGTPFENVAEFQNAWGAAAGSWSTCPIQPAIPSPTWPARDR
jgi:hypothetical protein